MVVVPPTEEAAATAEHLLNLLSLPGSRLDCFTIGPFTALGKGWLLNSSWHKIHVSLYKFSYNEI